MAMYGKNGFVRDLGDGRVEKFEPLGKNAIMENWFAHQMCVVSPQNFTKLHESTVLSRSAWMKLVKRSDIPPPLIEKFAKAKQVIRRVYDKIDITMSEYLKDNDMDPLDILADLCRICIKMKEYGWSHNDLHAANVGLRNGIITIIDYGEVRNSELSKGEDQDYWWLIVWMVQFTNLKNGWLKHLPALRRECPPHPFKKLAGTDFEFWAFMYHSPAIWERITKCTARLVVQRDFFKKYLMYYGDFKMFLDYILWYQNNEED